MSFKFAVGNIVQVPVKFTLKDGSINKLFSFSLTATRRTHDEIREYEDQVTEYFADKQFDKVAESMKSCLTGKVTDWSGQRLVLLDNNEPAPFTPEAFEFMLETPGVLNVVWSAYARECASKEKN